MNKVNKHSRLKNTTNDGAGNIAVLKKAVPNRYDTYLNNPG